MSAGALFVWIDTLRRRLGCHLARKAGRVSGSRVLATLHGASAIPWVDRMNLPARAMARRAAATCS
jgi:hypothetical protein